VSRGVLLAVLPVVCALVQQNIEVECLATVEAHVLPVVCVLVQQKIEVECLATVEAHVVRIRSIV